MLASDQNLLLQPEISPSVGLSYLNRCVQLAGAWSKLGGTATLVHDDLPARLGRQLQGLSIDLLPLSNVEQFAASVKPGWLLVDGRSGQPSVECSNAVGSVSDERWKLAATRKWAEVNGTRFQSPDLLISPDSDHLSSRLSQAGRILRGARYQLPKSGGPLVDFQSEAISVPSVARKILVWLSDEDSGVALAETLADVIEAASDRTSVDVIASVELRDSTAMIQLKKANPQLTLRYWSSIERRLQSMAPIHLAIVDREDKSQALAVREIPVVCINDSGSLPVVLKYANSRAKQFSIDTRTQETFRRSLSRLIRSREHRRRLIDSNPRNQNEQAANRIARSLATAGLRLEPATLHDWSEVSRWLYDPESFASALPGWNRDLEVGRTEFSAALNRASNPRWMFRLTCGMPIGMAFLDPYELGNNGSARVRILIKPAFRNQGYGTVLLERVLEQVLDGGDVRQVIVQARSSHHAARRMASKAGLEPMAPTVVDGVVAHQFSIDSTRSTQPLVGHIPMQRSA